MIIYESQTVAVVYVFLIDNILRKVPEGRELLFSLSTRCLKQRAASS